jgi:hypothetical protein
MERRLYVILFVLVLVAASFLLITRAQGFGTGSFGVNSNWVGTGTTGTITGTLLAVGGCDSGTATVTGAIPGQVAEAATTDGTFLGGSFDIRADVTSSNTVTVNICAKVLGTPASKAYNVRVIW